MFTIIITVLWMTCSPRFFLFFFQGHTLVPKIFPENPSLSSWVFRQRRHFRLREEGKAHSMTDQRLQQLTDVSVKL